MNKLKKTYLHSARNVLAVLLILLLCGSLWDLKISRFLYPGHESTFGQVFAAFGELPTFVAMICSGVLFCVCGDAMKKEFRILFRAGSAVMIVLALIISVNEATENVPALPGWVALLANVFAAVLASYGLLLLTRKCPAKTVFRFAFTMLFICVGTLALVYLAKIPWGRTRMRLIRLTGNDSYFTPWWKMGTALKDRLVADGVSAEEFHSFPSGHAACAACSWLLILLPSLNRKLRGKERLFVLIGSLWTVVVAFSRLQMGAHFLSDVTLSALVALGMCCLGIGLFYFAKKPYRWIWELISAKEPQKNAK